MSSVWFNCIEMSVNNLSTKRPKMEYEKIIFHAASNGKLERLKNILDNKSKEEIAPLVSATTNGSTPLLMACRNGHPSVVSYLIEKCHADIEQTGSVIFDGETIEGAAPLLCAAAAGHLNVVKSLLKYKASVNSSTKFNSLWVACFGGHFEIAKYLTEHGVDIDIVNTNGQNCLMIACKGEFYEIAKYLVECGADVNRKCDSGKTALHACAESGNLDLVKLLLLNGATPVSDSNGEMPLLSAALSGHAAVVDYLIQESTCTKQQKIDALELLGATLELDAISALDCWKRAMKLRDEDRDYIVEKPESRSTLASYVGAVEVRTLAQIEELASDPDAVRIQALLVKERILGAVHPDNLSDIIKIGSLFLLDRSHFKRCFQLWMYALDVMQKMEGTFSLRKDCLLVFTEIFSEIISESRPFAGGYLFVSFQDIFCIFERALKDIETGITENKNLNDTCINDFHELLTITLHLVDLMLRLQHPRMTQSEEFELKKAVYKLVHLNPVAKNGWTPLHIACFKDSSSTVSYGVFTFPSAEVVDLLLEVGASPNAVDFRNNTPLHVAAMNKPFFPFIFNSLLNHGAHLDECNSRKQTALQWAQHTPLLDIHPLQYVNLQCLSAKAVQSHKLPYKGLVDKKLEVFIDAH